MQGELDKMPNYVPKLGTNIAQSDTIDPQAVAAA